METYWIFEMLKVTIGMFNVRNAILKHYLHTNTIIEYGPTFTIGIAKGFLYKYLDKLIKEFKNESDKIILFTCNNDYGAKATDNEETHYQTFICYTKQKKILMIDPSRRRHSIGIYGPEASMFIYYYISSRYECKFRWLNLSSPCQIEKSDVFCQTWSLYLQIQAVLKNTDTIHISPIPEEKYKLLLDIYSSLVKNVDEFRKELLFNWTNTDPNDEFSLLYRAKDELPTDTIKEYMKQNILSNVLKLTVEDVYNPKRKLKVREDTREYYNKVSKEEIEDYYYIVMKRNRPVFTKKQIENVMTGKIPNINPRPKTKKSKSSPKKKSSPSRISVRIPKKKIIYDV